MSDDQKMRVVVPDHLVGATREMFGDRVEVIALSQTLLSPNPPATPRAWDDLDDTDFDDEADAERSFAAWQSEYDHNARR